MTDAVVRRESAAEYFKELVDGALAHQHIPAGELTSYYVVNLLTGFLQRPAEEDDTPMALRLAEAINAAGTRQRERLRQVGDSSLFLSGFFADSLQRKLVDVDYYASIGGTAYAALSRYETDAFASVFAELANNFIGFVDVLSEVSERASCSGSNADLLRLYERWLKTGSPRCGQLLAERGVVPSRSAKTSRVQ
jgi:hypothetical protein